MTPAASQRVALLKALVDAGPDGLTYRQIVSRGILDGKWVDARMRELVEQHDIKVVMGDPAKARPRRRGAKPRPLRWIYRGPKQGPIEPVQRQPSLLDESVGTAPVSALLGVES